MNQNLSFKVLALISAVSGVIVLLAVIFPLVLYERTSRQKYPDLLSPIVEKDEFSPHLEGLDYTLASNWFFGGGKKEEFASFNISHFTLSVPKLGIENATVAIGGEDLSASLIQYPGTALPGKNGNTVVFGHSVLPIFFDPEDYLSIFSTLPELTKGDEIYLDYDGISYKYEVEGMFEVLPTDIQVLDQGSGDSFLSLITCVPPGHPLKPRRLVVRAKIIPPEKNYATIGY